MAGGAGDDIYFVDSAGDRVVENPGEGSDVVQSSVTYGLTANVENLVLLGSGAINGVGNALNNSITGNAAGNLLAAGLGNDSLTGADGADLFVFDTAVDAITNVDTITDFNPGIDKLLLDDALFTRLVAGDLAAGNLAANPGGTAVDADDFLIYDTSTGALSYDADGNGAGAAVLFATLTAHPAITAADFAIV